MVVDLVVNAMLQLGLIDGLGVELQSFLGLLYQGELLALDLEVPPFGELLHLLVPLLLHLIVLAQLSASYQLVDQLLRYQLRISLNEALVLLLDLLCL